MASKDKPDPPEPRVDPGESREPPSRLRLPLKTMDDLQAELARIYREGKAGRRPIADVSRLANVLGILGRLIEGADVETRLEALEAERDKR